MTDHEINRAVAEARGWKPIDMGGAGEGWEKPNGGIGALPRVCTDPAAWGALLEWLHGQYYSPGITHDHHVWWSAYVIWSENDEVRRAEAMELSPGRALAVAFLRSKGHDIADPEY
jgi:hypothetical protein